MDLLPSSSVVEPAFSQLAMERGVVGKVKGGGEELATHTFVTPQLTTLVVENRVSADHLNDVHAYYHDMTCID